jgi:N-acetylneuraminate synthase/N,N'-diacetyllegionaminate synthase
MIISPTFDIAGRPVGGDAPCFIIAEAGVAHFGDFKKALKLVDLAAESGADAVKFQIFSVDKLIADEAAEWKNRLGSRSLPPEAFRDLRDYCRERGIIFFATAHDDESLDHLEPLNVPVYKIGSGELANPKFIARVAGLGKPVIYSTGLHTLADVRRSMEAMTSTGNRDIAILHCVTRYPTPADDVNLRAMTLLQEEFQGVTGYSDHTAGFHIPLAAIAMGANIVEKHISLDFNVPNAQDWKVSCGPHDLALFIQQAREVEASLGRRDKQPSSLELQSAAWARKSLVTTRDIPAGTILTDEMLTAKRPGTGYPPEMLTELVGKRTSVPLKADTVVKKEHLS